MKFQLKLLGCILLFRFTLAYICFRNQWSWNFIRRILQLFESTLNIYLVYFRKKIIIVIKISLNMLILSHRRNYDWLIIVFFYIIRKYNNIWSSFSIILFTFYRIEIFEKLFSLLNLLRSIKIVIWHFILINNHTNPNFYIHSIISFLDKVWSWFVSISLNISSTY